MAIIKRLIIVVDLEIEPFTKEYTAGEMAENLLTSWGEYTYNGTVVEAKWLTAMSMLMNLPTKNIDNDE